MHRRARLAQRQIYAPRFDQSEPFRGLSVGLPGVDDLSANVGKVFDVSCCEFCSSSHHNPCDLSVTYVYESTSALPFRGQLSRGFSRQYSAETKALCPGYATLGV